MQKTLVVYYSRTGNTKKIGDEIARRMKAEVEEIITLKDRKGIKGYIVSGFEASKKRSASIEKIKEDPKDYDLVIIGTPVWAWNISSPIRTYLEKKKDSFNKVAFFCTQGGSGDKKSFEEMEALTGKKPVAVLTLRTKEVAKGEYAEKVKEFIKQL